MAITAALSKHFGNRLPRTVVEPGRFIVGDAGVLQTEVVLISQKSYDDDVRWIYLDVGRFNGLAETEGEAALSAVTAARISSAEKVEFWLLFPFPPRPDLPLPRPPGPLPRPPSPRPPPSGASLR